MERTRRMCVGLAASAAAVVAAAGCGDAPDPRLTALEEGISRDSVITVLEAGPLVADAFSESLIRDGYWSEVYLLDGTPTEVLYYIPSGGEVPDTITREGTVPLVLRDGRLAGWGWEYWQEAAEGHGVALPPES